MDHRFALGVLQALHEVFLLHLHARVEIPGFHGGFHALDDHLWREAAAHLPRRVLPSGVIDFRVATIGADLIGEVAHALLALALGNGLAGPGEGARDKVVAGDDVINDAQILRHGAGDGVAGKDEAEGLLRAHEAGQALGAAGAGQEAQLHFRQAHGRLRRNHAVVGAEGHFQATAEGRAVDGGDHGLFPKLHEA